MYIFSFIAKLIHIVSTIFNLPCFIFRHVRMPIAHNLHWTFTSTVASVRARTWHKARLCTNVCSDKCRRYTSLLRSSLNRRQHSLYICLLLWRLVVGKSHSITTKGITCCITLTLSLCSTYLSRGSSRGSGIHQI